MFFLSVSTRFINARRRIVQPMIDQSNRAGKKNKKEQLTYSGEILLSLFFFPGMKTPFPNPLLPCTTCLEPRFLKGCPTPTPPRKTPSAPSPSSPFPFSQCDVFSSGAGCLLIDSNWRFPSLSGERGILALFL